MYQPVLYQPVHVPNLTKCCAYEAVQKLTEIIGVWYTRDHNPHFLGQAVIHNYAANAQSSIL